MQHHLAKLTDAQALAVYQSKKKFREIAAQYGMSHGSIASIKAGRSYKHVTQHLPPPHKNLPGPPRKLTNEQATAIYQSRDSLPKLAQRFKLAQHTVWLIKNGRLYKDVTGKLGKPIKNEQGRPSHADATQG